MMKVISVGFDLDEVEQNIVDSKPGGEEDSATEAGARKPSRERNGVRQRTRGGNAAKKGEKDVSESSPRQKNEELTCLPGWFEFAGR